MSATEGVVDILNRVVDLFHFARREGFRLFEAVAELSTERFSADELLISGHHERWCAHVFARLVAVFRTRRVLLAVGEVRRVDVDQLHVEIGIGAAGRNEKFRRDWSRDGDIFGQHWRLINQHVGAAPREALV